MILSIKYKLVYVVRDSPCNSIGRYISEIGHLDTPVMLGTNKNPRRPTSSWNSSSFLIHLIISAPPSTSAEDKTHFGVLLQQLSYILLLWLEFSQPLFADPSRPLSARDLHWLPLSRILFQAMAIPNFFQAHRYFPLWTLAITCLSLSSLWGAVRSLVVWKKSSTSLVWALGHVQIVSARLSPKTVARPITHPSRMPCYISSYNTPTLIHLV